MAATLPSAAAEGPLPTSEKAGRMAKAGLRDLRKAENDSTVGRAIARAQSLRGWSLKEFSDAAQRNERQLARWMDGREHPQLDTLFAIESFREPLLVALAEMAGVGVVVETVVRFRSRRRA